jgi:hypothetical protein
MNSTRVLITVKTYPTLSTKYGELVCTAGIRESDGAWVRIYPMPFRRMQEEYHYRKYQWVSMQLVKNEKDRRPESYRPINLEDMDLQEVIGTSNKWAERKSLVLRDEHMFTSLGNLIAQTKEGKRSLAVFKPREYRAFSVEQTDREWPREKLEHCKAYLLQPGLFSEDYYREIEPVEKIPYKFKYKILDDDGRESSMMIEDWEICQLYRNSLRRTRCEDAALAKVREKCEMLMTEKDLYLFLGTTLQWHDIAPNPYIIIGLFYPPKVSQLGLFP